MAYCHYWNGKYMIHSEIFPKPTAEVLKKVKKISQMIDDAFRTKGVKKLYTWGENGEQKRYNLFLGYKETGRTVNDTFVSNDYPYPVYEYEKDLT